MAKSEPSSKKDLIVCADVEEEESGWTSYFEDFSLNTNSSSCFTLCGGDASSSLISDAASCAACKFSHHQNHHLLSWTSSNNYGVPPNLPDKKLRFKKSSRANLISEDDPLEDTATSPLNSPKDGDLNPTKMISRKTADHDLYVDSTGDKFISENISDSKRGDEVHSKDEKNTKGMNNNMNYTDLKKGGLTLFPLSMLVNYFG